MELDARIAPVTVHVTVAARSEHVSSDGLLRYRSVEGSPVLDENTGDNPLVVPRLRPSLSLHLTPSPTAPSSKYVGLPLARIAFRDEAYLLEDYEPPRALLTRDSRFHRCARGVALRHPDEYPMNAGRIVSSSGLDIAAADYETEFLERQVPHSTALHSELKRRGAYLVGPMARYALNHDHLPAEVQALAEEVGLQQICRNPFRSVLVHAIEIIYACGEALNLIAKYEPPSQSFVAAEPRVAVGYACTEAPRGLLYHFYRLDPEGTILDARLVPPTSQNQGVIEEDLRAVAAANLDSDEDTLTAHCEQSIRNHDPCISCAAHFLTLQVHRI